MLVGGKRAWILRRVRSASELSWVDEDGDDYGGSGAARGGDQRGVTGVERPHGGYERNRSGELGESLVEFGTSGDGAHRPEPELAREFVEGGDQCCVASNPLRCAGEAPRLHAGSPGGEGGDRIVAKVGDAPSVAWCGRAE